MHATAGGRFMFNKEIAERLSCDDVNWNEVESFFVLREELKS